MNSQATKLGYVKIVHNSLISDYITYFLCQDFFANLTRDQLRKRLVKLLELDKDGWRKYHPAPQNPKPSWNPVRQQLCGRISRFKKERVDYLASRLETLRSLKTELDMKTNLDSLKTDLDNFFNSSEHEIQAEMERISTLPPGAAEDG